MSANKNMSLFVPHVFPNFTKEYVSAAFSTIGVVERVDFVAKLDRNRKQYNAAYIHFSAWHNNSDAKHIQDDIQTHGQTKMFHDDSEYYWIVLPNTATKNDPFIRKQTIELGDAKTINLKSVVPEKRFTESDFPSLQEDENAFFETMEDIQMDEIEEELEQVDEHLISIDSRYVKTIEEENHQLRCEIAMLKITLMQMSQHLNM